MFIQRKMSDLLKATVAKRAKADYAGHVDSKSAGLVILHHGFESHQWLSIEWSTA